MSVSVEMQAILLSLEGVFGALGGWLILREILSPRALVGCALMLTGMLVSQLARRKPVPTGAKVNAGPPGVSPP